MILGLYLALLLAPPSPSQAGPLDPTAFTSLGAFPTAPGTYAYSVVANVPMLSGPGGTFSGVFAPNAGDFLRSEGRVAVFDFDSILLRSDQTIRIVSLLGGPVPQLNPLALLSRSDVMVQGTIDAFGFGGGAGGRGVGGDGGGTGGGGGGGFGGTGGGGGGLQFPGNGGLPYGDLTLGLFGGSGGGNGRDLSGFGSGGGRGGGVLEIGAEGSITVTRGSGLSGLFASGQAGPGGSSSTMGGGGGGSGGGIFLHGDSVVLDPNSVLDVTGGAGGSGGRVAGGGGGGGGGRVLIEVTGPEGFANNGGLIRLAGASGGSGAGGGGSSGAAGTFALIGPVNMDTPEPASFVLAAMGLVGLAGLRAFRSARRPLRSRRIVAR